MLQIQDPLERRFVAAADAGLAFVSALMKRVRRSGSGADARAEPRRILLLRLERIGDLVMALPAIRDVRACAEKAEIDLVVGSWNAALARSVSSVDSVITLDASWLARDREGRGVVALLRQALTWRERHYDLAINFEPDIRSNLVIAAAGAARTVGWRSGGGGPVLDLAIDYDVTAHTTANARRLVAEAFGRRALESARPLLSIPEGSSSNAAARLATAIGGPLVGVHVSGGRAIKQWESARFAEVARRLAESRGATIVATGGPGDRALVDALRMAIAPHPVIDVSGVDDLMDSAAVLARLDVLVTGDTGPMHLASAVGTPVVAIFGPSDPARYATAGPLDRVVRVDLPCSPCNRIRQPPARCVGHTPDCLNAVSADAVLDAANAVLDARQARLARAHRS